MIQTRLTNSGNQPIRTDDFSRALAFVFDEQTQVIDYTVTSTVPSNIGMVLTQTLQYRIEVLPLLLNPGDTATLRFIAIRNDNSAANFRVDTRIEGIRDVQFSDATINNYNPWRGVISIISGLLVGAVIIVISILKIRLRTRIILISLIIIISLLFASSLQFLLP